MQLVLNERIETKRCTIITDLRGMNNTEHWYIANKTHWSLEVNFNEDENRTRTDNSAKKLSIIRRVGLNLLKTDTTLKIVASLLNKRWLDGTQST
jgi:predicted transposase YbfD/YdcC